MKQCKNQENHKHSSAWAL